MSRLLGAAERRRGLWLLADWALCCIALAVGRDVATAQVVGWAVVVAAAGARVFYPTGAARRGVLSAWLLVSVLLYFLRAGIVMLLSMQHGGSPYMAVLSAALVSAVALVSLESPASPVSPPAAGALNLTAMLPWVIGYAVLLRLVFSAQVELLPEETYYWNYSQHLDIGYLDHPPMVAWLIHAGTALFGNTEFGVRVGAMGCGVVTGYFIYRLTLDVMGKPAAWVALTLSQVLPFFFLSGMLMTPDAPLTAAWAATLYFLERAMIAGRPRAWLGVGIAMGLGLLSKYTIGLLGVSALLFMLLDVTSRRWLRRIEPYAAVVVAALVFAPVIVWNAEHQWASFAFQTARRLAERPRFSLHKLVGGALVLLTPTGLVAVVAALSKMTRQSAAPPAAREVHAARFLRIAVLLPLGVFAGFSLRHEVKLDWTGAPWVAALPLLAAGLGEAMPVDRATWQRRAWPITWMILLLVYAGGFYHLVRGIPGLGYSDHTELQPVGWRDFGRQVDALAAATRREFGAPVLVVGMDRYAIASERAFYAHDQAQAVANTSSWHLFGDMGLMYERWFPVEQQLGRTLLLIAFDPSNLADAHLQAHVGHLDPVHESDLQRAGVSIRRFYYRVAHEYR